MLSGASAYSTNRAFGLANATWRLAMNPGPTAAPVWTISPTWRLSAIRATSRVTAIPPTWVASGWT